MHAGVRFGAVVIRSAAPFAMRIERLEIRNFRCLRRTVLADLPRMAIFVGANGTGKSTLFDVFSFLQESLTSNVAVAVARRGGFAELRTRAQPGPVAITVEFRESGGRLATYTLEIAEDSGRVVIRREILQYRRGARGKPRRLLSFRDGSGFAITDESACGPGGAEAERKEFRLADPGVPAVKGLGQFRDFRVASEFRNIVENWRISDALPGADVVCAEHRSPQSANVARAARSLYENHRDRFDRILKVMKSRVPGVERIEARTTEDGNLALRFRDGALADPFTARQVSDGAIRLFACLVLLHDPEPRSLLAVEGPENRLHAPLRRELAGEFRGYALRGGQVFLSTQSPDFLDGAELDEVFWLVKSRGVSAARRASDDEQLRRLAEEGDRPGALWKQGLFPGADPQ